MGIEIHRAAMILFKRTVQKNVDILGGCGYPETHGSDAEYGLPQRALLK